ncbi:protease FtsH subunit HflC [Fulvimarina manganoxydans]|uniref:Protease FtsH subunit HflC n=1 Tax=Fulvimarina manganoxydans TaxID=937218 RepID=A0A1W1YJF4_9HYPH|nr:protease FtsH subunit HflC [Fulvimarina manganoxydans]
MANRFYALIALVAVAALLLWNSIFIVNEKEQAIVLRFGEIQRVEQQPGLYFKLPFSFAGADNVQMLPDRLLRFDLDDIRVQVSGGRFYVVDAFMVYEIADAARFRQQVSGSIPQAEQRLRTRLDAALRRVYGLRGFEAALSNERGEMMRQVRDEIRPDAASLGIEIADVRIRRTDLTDEVSQQTYERMQAERLAEAERLRARGQVAAREIRAGADREVSETLASAQRESEIVKGQGDAERNRIFANAFGADPEFFDFYRSMNAYRQALENSGTTMLLSPDSEFFRYFRSDNAGGQSGSLARPAPLIQPQGTGASSSGASQGENQASTSATPENGTEASAEAPVSSDTAADAGSVPGVAQPGVDEAPATPQAGASTASDATPVPAAGTEAGDASGQTAPASNNTPALASQ